MNNKYLLPRYNRDSSNLGMCFEVGNQKREIIQYLTNYSFKLNGVYNINNDEKGIAIQGDFLFIKQQLCEDSLNV